MTDRCQTEPIDKGHEDPVAQYSESFKNSMVAKLVGPHAKTATVLATEVGVSQPTLSRWKREAGTVGKAMAEDSDRKAEVPSAPAKRPQDWTAEEKWALVVEAASVPEAELGALLRRKGVHEAQLVEWRAAALAGLQRPSKRERKAANAERLKVRTLERELRRKDKALAEAAALLVLKKKAQAIWGDEDDDTTPKNDE
jgi:transposase-like protein